MLEYRVKCGVRGQTGLAEVRDQRWSSALGEEGQGHGELASSHICYQENIFSFFLGRFKRADIKFSSPPI